VLYELTPYGGRQREKTVPGQVLALDDTGFADTPDGTSKLEYTIDTSGRLQGVTDLVTGVVGSIQTDAAGRINHLKMPGGPDRSFTWDPSGRLLKAITDGVQSDYRYDFRGWRTQETVNGHTTAFHWGADDVLEEQGPGGPLTYERFDDVVSAVGGQRVLRDGMGSIVGKWNGTQPQKQRRYEPFGQFRTNGTNWTQPTATDATLAYAGQYNDTTSQLSYANQRWYAPELGRFLSEDPLGATASRVRGGYELDGYGYGRGNPGRWMDPNGEWSWTKGGNGLIKSGKAFANVALAAGRVTTARFGGWSGYYDENGEFQFTKPELDEAMAESDQVRENTWSGTGQAIVHPYDNLVKPAGESIGSAAGACSLAIDEDGVVGDEASQVCGELAPGAIANTLLAERRVVARAAGQKLESGLAKAEARFQALATDPDKGFLMTEASKREAKLAIQLEYAGEIGEVERAPGGSSADFIEKAKPSLKWDAKSPQSIVPNPKGRGEFKLSTTLEKVSDDFKKGVGILFDTSGLSQADEAALRGAINDLAKTDARYSKMVRWGRVPR
jgi:RHS repeat-associated protein